ncbi:NTP transferase domain-containing protein [Desulfovibrio piger]|uniref:NTP transferase domain-containing protein n=1 Tax=Desulfovibrio piger TaxID=901 RepID=UPI0032BF7BD4
MQTAKSIVIACAGIGSRLGLGTTKSLIKINGKPLIQWQLEMLSAIQDDLDIRIVVGFQATEVIKVVKQIRDDVIFVLNNNYFERKTGSSYYLGAKDAHGLIIELDGDLLIHPEDMKKCLNTKGEWCAYSDISSTDAVFVNLDDQGNVVEFSKESGQYEWSGPCCLRKEHIEYTDSNVYNILERHLPIKGIKVRAYDIDTYDDYMRVLKTTKDWIL